ncbi:MAG: M20/M25/M40 family metallo-hydrolase [Acidobacteria bacterium]|nr:M20/M25/M40 family metallo-hydrolase [Acidobacteriota bacterium]
MNRWDNLSRVDVVELTKRLIAIPSTSGAEEAVARFVAAYLEGIGMIVELQPVADGRPNVYARHGNPDVVLSTHTDTVPPHIEPREDDDYVYGRGACDAKGIIAAMIGAVEQLIAGGITDVGLLFVVGEEAGSPGARAANAIATGARYLVNGEPTESKLARGTKGSLRVVLTTRGRAAHSAYPELGESAIDALLDVLYSLRQVEWPTDPVLGKTTVNVGRIRGGVAANVIAPDAEAELLVRLISSADSVKGLIDRAVAGRATIEYTFGCDPVLLETLDGFDATIVSFTTDIPLLTAWGRPLLIGPGSIRDAHTAGEKISKFELRAAVGLYAELVKTLKQRQA